MICRPKYTRYENISILGINQVLVSKNTHLKGVQGDGVMVVVIEVDDEEEGGGFGGVGEVVVVSMEMKEEEDEGKKLE